MFTFQKYNVPEILNGFYTLIFRMHYCNHNGKLVKTDAIDIDSANSAFRHGYSLVETMLLRNGEIALESRHWERLFEGMRSLNFSIPRHFTKQLLQNELLKCIKKNGLEQQCRVRLQVYTTINSVFEQEKLPPHFLIECFPMDDAIIKLNENGLICGLAKGIVKNADSYSHLKTGSMLPYILAANQAKKQGWNDALICNSKENIVESTIANIFWIKNKIIYTPSSSEGCVEGIMKQFLTEKLQQDNINVEEKALTKTLLDDADEVFLTNAVRGIKWVKMIGETGYTNEFTIKTIYPYVALLHK
jgi:branched-chain amino acid aminotransferase